MLVKYKLLHKASYLSGLGSSVGIATAYELDGPRIESRWGGRDFPHVSRPALGSSYTMGSGSFPGLKSGRGVTLTPHPLLVPWLRKGRAIRGLLEKYPTFGREKETGLLGALDT